MYKVLLSSCVMVALSVGAASSKKPVYNHVPEKLPESVRQITPIATNLNHVLIVNVNNAIPQDIFPTVVTYALSRINLNAWTNSIDRSIVKDLIETPNDLKRLLGDRVVVAVFLEKNATGPSFLNAPGHWSMVNMRGIARDKPEAQKLRDRYAKMILKGLGHACGVGASVDELCALYYDSYTLDGIDKVDIRLSPMAYFPMLSTLRAIGGNDVTSPAYE